MFKEVWTHSTSRWLWLMADLVGHPHVAAPPDSTISITSTAARNGVVRIRVTVSAPGEHRLEVGSNNLQLRGGPRTLAVRQGRTSTVEWRGRPADANAPWMAVVIPDGDHGRRIEVRGAGPH